MKLLLLGTLAISTIAVVNCAQNYKPKSFALQADDRRPPPPKEDGGLLGGAEQDPRGPPPPPKELARIRAQARMRPKALAQTKQYEDYNYYDGNGNLVTIWDSNWDYWTWYDQYFANFDWDAYYDSYYNYVDRNGVYHKYSDADFNWDDWSAIT